MLSAVKTAAACLVLVPSTAHAQTLPAGEELGEIGADGPEEGETEAIVVQGTRIQRRVGDEPIRVEVLDREEVEEKILMRPGNIAMLLSETGGLRVQVTSPALGAANIRVQGLEGRYTQLLADGLPLYGGQASSLGLLQIPPTDLGQVEVIKGAASALYGASALGGVINLISRRPGEALQAETLLNATTRDGQDATAYLASPFGGGWSGSVTGGLHRQTRHDLDGDGWTDIAAYERFTVRPRLFWEGAGGATAFATVGAMGEDRRGGTAAGCLTPDGRFFPKEQRTKRLDAGLVAALPLGGMTANLRASGVTQDHRHLYGDVVEDDRHGTVFAEAALSGVTGSTAWVAGLAYQRDVYRNDTFPAFNYTFDVPGLFAQAEHRLTDNITLAASGRVDAHSEYGTKVSPRLSALWRPGFWTVRASYGRGFFAPTPFVDEIEAAGLQRLEPLGDLRAEKGETASLDVGYARETFEANATLFGANLTNTTELVPTGPQRVRLMNVAGPARTRGVELLLRYRLDEVTATGSYVYVNATESSPFNPGRRCQPLTPRHTAGLVAVWEREGVGRVGAEAYYTGRQALDDNPFRNTSPAYFELGLLGEVVLGRVRLFVNAENLLGVRQTKRDSLVRPTRAPDGRYTVDVWGPTDGVVVNGGVRIAIGG